mmetsp:Transcript_31858/g.36219  ORF Transcript_31858/g.36219 Transcript_31858/m.36219 type:complete len:468 (+) Transcript_31858:25-1428(+)
MKKMATEYSLPDIGNSSEFLHRDLLDSRARMLNKLASQRGSSDNEGPQETRSGISSQRSGHFYEGSKTEVPSPSRSGYAFQKPIRVKNELKNVASGLSPTGGERLKNPKAFIQGAIIPSIDFFSTEEIKRPMPFRRFINRIDDNKHREYSTQMRRILGISKSTSILQKFDTTATTSPQPTNLKPRHKPSKTTKTTAIDKEKTSQSMLSSQIRSRRDPNGGNSNRRHMLLQKNLHSSRSMKQMVCLDSVDDTYGSFETKCTPQHRDSGVGCESGEYDGRPHQYVQEWQRQEQELKQYVLLQQQRRSNQERQEFPLVRGKIGEGSVKVRNPYQDNHFSFETRGKSAAHFSDDYTIKPQSLSHFKFQPEVVELCRKQRRPQPYVSNIKASIEKPRRLGSIEDRYKSAIYSRKGSIATEGKFHKRSLVLDVEGSGSSLLTSSQSSPKYELKNAATSGLADVYRPTQVYCKK